MGEGSSSTTPAESRLRFLSLCVFFLSPQPDLQLSLQVGTRGPRLFRAGGTKGKAWNVGVLMLF